MCGIVGYVSANPGKNDRFKLFKLLKQSRIRGIHSYGISYLDKGKIQTEKFYQNEFNKIKIPHSKLFIFHNRYSTSGDFRNHKNNQPLQIEDTSMVFNGVIDMRTKEEMQSAWGIKMTSDNDGEIVLRKSDLDPHKMLEIIKVCGSYSGLVLKVFKDDARLYAMTNGYRPLWILKDGDSFFFASTKDIFIRAFGDVCPKQLQINTVKEWQITK